MLKYDSFYFQCPHCQAWLEGRNLKAEMVNQAILYSDGKVLNDNLITTPQKMIMCPSCGHSFWVEHPEEPFITYEKPDAEVYSWNTWRFFGISFSDNKGKMALINHYKTFLKKSHYDPKKEIYLRRFLWWAYNDLHRNHQHVRLKYLLNGFMSFGVWHCNRKLILDRWVAERISPMNYYVIPSGKTPGSLWCQDKKEKDGLAVLFRYRRPMLSLSCDRSGTSR